MNSGRHARRLRLGIKARPFSELSIGVLGLPVDLPIRLGVLGADLQRQNRAVLVFLAREYARDAPVVLNAGRGIK
jgi:hypothetical protein